MRGGSIFLEIFHQYVPDGNDVAETTDENEEMEDGVHIPLFIKGIEDGTSDVTDTLGDNPDNGSCRYGIDEGLKGH